MLACAYFAADEYAFCNTSINIEGILKSCLILWGKEFKVLYLFIDFFIHNEKNRTFRVFEMDFSLLFEKSNFLNFESDNISLMNGEIIHNRLEALESNRINTRYSWFYTLFITWQERYLSDHTQIWHSAIRIHKNSTLWENEWYFFLSCFNDDKWFLCGNAYANAIWIECINRNICYLFLIFFQVFGYTLFIEKIDFFLTHFYRWDYENC